MNHLNTKLPAFCLYSLKLATGNSMDGMGGVNSGVTGHAPRDLLRSRW